MTIIRVSLCEARLRRLIRAHLRALGFTKAADGTLEPPGLDKGAYRQLHAGQRIERSAAERLFVAQKAAALILHFANGDEIDVDRIAIKLIPISHTTWESDLFRLATLLWSIPVSMGFGRRL